jgi:hypothetical protein
MRFFRHVAEIACTLASEAPQLTQFGTVALLSPRQTGHAFFQPAMGFFFSPSRNGVLRGSNLAVLLVSSFFLKLST